MCLGERDQRSHDDLPVWTFAPRCLFCWQANYFVGVCVCLVSSVVLYIPLPPNIYSSPSVPISPLKFYPAAQVKPLHNLQPRSPNEGVHPDGQGAGSWLQTLPHQGSGRSGIEFAPETSQNFAALYTFSSKRMSEMVFYFSTLHSAPPYASSISPPSPLL